MRINRDYYLDKLINRMHNGMIKVITGIKYCGKSYLLFELFNDYLVSKGVKEDHIIKIALDDRMNIKLRDPDALCTYVHSLIKDNDMYYILLDEIQFVSEFEDVLNSFLHIKNLDTYVTGSNAKFLSKDIITEFRGRGDEVYVSPLSFKEFLSAFNGDKNEAWNEYKMYGGLPFILSCNTDEQKVSYLKNLFEETYMKDIINRNHVLNKDCLNDLVNIVASSIGSLTNPNKLMNTFSSLKHIDIGANTIKEYLDYLCDSFIVSRADRYDVKGKKYISTPQKYYFTDIGLRNAKLGFRQIEENHIMENIIYNELKIRGYNVDVGVVTINDKNENNNNVRKQLECDFIATLGYKKIYIQSALNVDTEEKMKQETKSLINIDDSFQKIIVVKDDIKKYQNEDGILVVGIKEFLLDDRLI